VSATTLPYNLRLKKAIDRNIFVDLLKYTTQAVAPNEVVYISMGGAYLQDHADVHSLLGYDRLVSFDQADWVVRRQLFNRPVNCIHCLRMSSDDIADNPDPFFLKYVGKNNCAIWLDFTNTARGDQLNQIRAMTPFLKHGDILKITMNAQIQSLYTGTAEDTIGTIQRKRLDSLKEQLDAFFPATSTPDDMTEAGIASILGAAFFFACAAGVQRSYLPVPLTSFRYADGQQMATFCVAVIQRGLKTEYLDRLRQFKLRTLDLTDVKEIAVPALSLREKVEIDRILFNRSSPNIRKKLKLSLAASDPETNSAITQYKAYYRYYPKFAQISAV
jgi:hypothetical protein